MKKLFIYLKDKDGTLLKYSAKDIDEILIVEVIKPVVPVSVIKERILKSIKLSEL